MKTVKNIQFQQFLNLLLLLIVATINQTIQISWLQIALLALFASAVEVAFSYYYKREIFIPYSAMITAFGIVLMIGWTKWYIPYILIAISIAQKWLIRVSNRHLFNPSNFAVVFALALFFPKAMPIVGQLGYQGYFVIFLIIIIAIAILVRVNRYIISFSFIIFYILLEYLFMKYYDPHWKLDDFLTNLYSTSFIVYILFMLTDPRVTPNSKLLQAIFAFVVALIVATFDFLFSPHLKNLFIALFVTTPIFFVVDNSIEGKEKTKYIIFLFLCVIISVYVLKLPSRYFSM